MFVIMVIGNSTHPDIASLVGPLCASAKRVKTFELSPFFPLAKGERGQG